jgi:nucleotidyltransferase/DNA polymerase involved in DNA repair
MSRSLSHRPAQLLEALSLEVAQPVQAKTERASSFAALWIADPPTWALGRLEAGVPRDVPLVAVSGERVVGSNLLARKAGVLPQESLSRARQLCPNLQAYEHDPPAMLAAWDAAIATAYSFTPWVEPSETGLLFCGGLTPQEAEQLALLSDARVGLAPSRSTAQLAALTAAEGQSRWVNGEAAFLARVPIRYLLGLGFAEEMVERLSLYGIEHLADIHRLSLTRKQLQAQFKQEGIRLYQIAHAELSTPVSRYQEPLEATRYWEFEEPVIEPFEYLPILHLLVAQAALELGSKVCWTVTVRIVYKNGHNTRRRVLGAATNNPKALLNVAELTFADAHHPGKEISALEATLGRIVLPPYQQLGLFGGAEKPQVHEAIERVDARFNGGVGQIKLIQNARFREQGWRYVPLGPSQQRQVGQGRRVK